MPRDDYKTWTKQQLADEIRVLKKEIRTRTGANPDLEQQKKETNTPPRKKGKVDPSKYTSRHIALKFAYLGKNYSGFEYSTAAALPSIETELWRALVTACLIFPEDENKVDFTCCDYSKCGRTDRGVSAFGQVIGLRVRSNGPLPKESSPEESQDGSIATETREGVVREAGGVDAEAEGEPKPPPPPFDPLHDEIPYARILNRILPKDIRILAWCPTPPPDFSARFSCRERQYRYFFTNPAFPPEPVEMETAESKKMDVKPGWLNTEAMKEAAGYYVGEHDFRNLCKIDPTKQLTNYTRVMYESTIEEVEDLASAIPYLKDTRYAPAGISQDQIYPKVYCFKVRGSAFLYHQIRHMVAILFLVGQGLEKPTVVRDLLDVQTNPRKPNYTTADDAPLVLWDCVFGKEGEKDGVEWRHIGSEATSQKYGSLGVMSALWETWREKKMDEILANRLLGMVSEQGSIENMKVDMQAPSTKVYEGGTVGRTGGAYKPLMKRPTLETPDEINQRYAKRVGFGSSEEMKAAGGFAARKEKKAAKKAAESGEAIG